MPSPPVSPFLTTEKAPNEKRVVLHRRDGVSEIIAAVDVPGDVLCRTNFVVFGENPASLVRVTARIAHFREISVPETGKFREFNAVSND